MKDECYEFIKGPNNKVSIVGFGSYGEVKLAKNSETGEIVAIKMVTRSSCRSMDGMPKRKSMSITNSTTPTSSNSSITTMKRIKT